MTKYMGGLAGVWSTEKGILEAAKKVHSSGYRKFETITPYPVHGMDDAMGLKRSFIPWVTFFLGLTGCALGFAFQWWTSAVSWPLNIGGKPLFSAPAFIPVTFELTVLFGSLCSVAACFIACGLPKFQPPIIDPSFTDDKFGLFIPEDDTGYDVSKIDGLFKELGAEEVRKVGEF
jgi:hypothetical protein